MTLPKTCAAWKVVDFTGFDSTTFDEHAPMPEIGEYDCLVKIEAASLNFRDLMIANGTYPFPAEKGVVPGSDGAGVVVAVGKNVTRFAKGDKVYTISHAGYQSGWLDEAAAKTSLGGSLDGTFREYGAFPEWALVSIPEVLDFKQAAALPVAGITAWNALYGIPGLPLKSGDVVLTQGTGGVSVFAIQFALAAGATVVATTSSSDKMARLKRMGVQHVLNYKETKEWGQEARKLGADGQGVDFVIEVGGGTTLEQSLAAIRRGGIIALCGSVGGFGEGIVGPPLISAWTSSCIARGVAVGSRAHAEEMNKAIQANRLQPVLDPTVFALRDLKAGYRHLEEQKHFGKVIIDCSS